MSALLRGDELAKAAYLAARQADPLGRGMTVAELEEALAQRGIAVRGPRADSTLGAAVTRAGHLFRKDTPGRWVWRPGHDGSEPVVPPGLSGKVLARVAHKVVRELDPSNDGMHYRAIRGELERRGFRLRGPNELQTLRNALWTNPDLFENRGRSMWSWRAT